jgi:hypothetical protein
MELLGEDDRYKFEVQVDQAAKLFSGVTYSYKTTVFYGKASCKGTVNAKTKKVLLEELKIVEVRMSGASDACIMTCFLQYSKLGDEEFLEGTYTSMNVTDSSNCGRGTVFLRKVTTSDFYKEPFLVNKEKAAATKKAAPKKTDTSAVAKTTTTRPPVKKPPVSSGATVKKTAPATKPPVKKPAQGSTALVQKPDPKQNTDIRPAVPEKPETRPTVVDSVKKSVPVTVTPRVLASRENELVKTIVTGANEIIVNIYDNGSIDNDTVSIYLDKKLMLSKKRLTEKPLTIKFNLDETNSFHELVMVAENLGEIPPNTSLMTVKAGAKQFDVRITSTEQKNAVVVFKYEKSVE